MISQGRSLDLFCMWVLVFISITCAANREGRNIATLQQEIEDRLEEIESIHDTAEKYRRDVTVVRISGDDGLTEQLRGCMNETVDKSECLISFLVAVVNMPEFENYSISEAWDCDASNISADLLNFQRTVKLKFSEILDSLHECEEHPLILYCDRGECDTIGDFWYAVSAWTQFIRDMLDNLDSLSKTVTTDADIGDVNSSLGQRCQDPVREKRQEKKEAKKQRAEAKEAKKQRAAAKKEERRLRKQEKRRRQRQRDKAKRQNNKSKKSSERQTI